MSDALSDVAPSPWWPCPECGEIYFETTCTFERGRWVSDDEYRIDDPPKGYPSAIRASDVRCSQCGFVFDIFDYYKWGEFVQRPGFEEE